MTDHSKNQRIAIVGLPALVSFALSELIADISPHWSIRTFSAYDEIPSSVDFHIVSTEVFMRHLQFFIPRKKLVAVFTGDRQFVVDGILTLCLHDNPSAIVSRLGKAVAACREESGVSAELTPREKDVLCLLASGRTIKEIASELCISVNTALTHRKNISSKLGIRSVSGLSLYAMMNGLIGATH